MDRRLSIFAGEGQLVPEVLHKAAEQGWQIQLFNLSKRDDLAQWDPGDAELLKPLAILLKLRSFAPTHICMVGGLTISDKQREGILGFLRSKSRRQRSTGDTGLSRLISAMEFATGAKVIGVHEIVPDLRAPDGVFAGPEISSQSELDCAFGIKIAHIIGDLDIGQAVVCSGRRIIGVEDIAGTDALLKRVANHVRDGMTGNGSDPLILTKAKKPNQPETTDLPAIGPQTVEQAHGAGVAIICVEAHSTLLIDKSRLMEMANELEITLVGVGGAQ